MSNARERRPQTVEQRAQETTTANGPRGSEDMYYEAMTVGTTQVNGGTSYEGMHLAPSINQYLKMTQ